MKKGFMKPPEKKQARDAETERAKPPKVAVAKKKAR